MLEIEMTIRNVCFEIMLTSSGTFHLGHSDKVLRDINIRVLYHWHWKHTYIHSESITVISLSGADSASVL